MEEKKIRVQLYDDEGRLISDKLFKQTSEYATGPKFEHNGPMRIELTMDNKEDVEKAILYLQKISGMLPLTTKVKKVKKAKIDDEDVDFAEKVYEDVVKKASNQDELIQNLRNLGFVFVTRDLLNVMERFSKVEWTENDWRTDKYQYMVKVIKTSKNPMLDRFDPTIIVGIKIFRKRDENVSIYMYGKYTDTIQVKVPNKSIESFSTQKLHIFPEYMSEKEKERFRKEYREMEMDESKTPSPFFIRWNKWVKTSQPLKQMEELDNESEDEE